MIYVFWTCSNIAEAKQIIHVLLEQRLIACASLVPVHSIYRWEGKIEEGDEMKVILKTQPYHFDAIRLYIETHCSYSVPEIVQLNAMQGAPNYLSWVVKETSS